MIEEDRNLTVMAMSHPHATHLPAAVSHADHVNFWSPRMERKLIKLFDFARRAYWTL